MLNFSIAICFLCLVHQATTSLLCNPGFQQYGLVPDWTGSASASKPSNTSCWYDPNNKQLSIKLLSPSLTTTVRFPLFNVFSLCQNVVLQSGVAYQLGFTVVNQLMVTSSKVQVKINGMSIYNHSTFFTMSPTYGSCNFVTTSSANQICFSTTVFSWLLTPGACLDNVTLTELYPSSNNTNNTNTTTNTTANITLINNTITNTTNPNNSTSSIN